MEKVFKNDEVDENFAVEKSKFNAHEVKEQVETCVRDADWAKVFETDDGKSREKVDFHTFMSWVFEKNMLIEFRKNNENNFDESHEVET